MAYRFKARSTTPGEYRLASGTLAQLVALGDIALGVGRGDGGVGTFASPPLAKVLNDTSWGAGGTEFTGTYDAGDEYANGYSAGLVAQYITDAAEVTAKRDHLQDTEVICGVAGTLDMDLYTLVATPITWGTDLGFSETPTGALAVPLAKLATLVAESATFRTRVGAATAALATPHIHFPCLDSRHLKDALPCAVIQHGPAWALEAVAFGSHNEMWPANGGNSLRLILADRDRFPKSLESSALDFLNWVGGVLNDIASVAGEDDHLDISAIRQEVPPVLPTTEEDASGTVWWKAAYLISWR